MWSWQDWRVVPKTYPGAVALADRHYSRQSVGSKFFTRPGDSLVMVTLDELALWVSWRSIHARRDGLAAWECVLFRNESARLSSGLIHSAVLKTVERWGWVNVPIGGFVTYVDVAAVRGVMRRGVKMGGYCFDRAGFYQDGFSKRRGLARWVLERDVIGKWLQRDVYEVVIT